MRKYNWKKIIVSSLWVIAGIGAIVLLGAAIQKKGQKLCTDIKVEITGAQEHMFIDEKDVLEIIHSTGKVEGNQVTFLNLREMEKTVEKNAWVKNAEMFIDNNQVLQVRIDERQPVARVFTLSGSSFYLDSGALRLPLSEKLSARVPSFTGYPSDKKILAKPDSLLLSDIVSIGKYIMADSFWRAQVAQIDITPQAGFEMVPVVGDHIVALGNAENLDRKFKHLYAFYQQVWIQNGMNNYEKLDVQYANQVVAVKKGAGKAQIDSARAYQLMQEMINRTREGASDSAETSTAAAPKIIVPKTAKDSAAVAKPVTAIVKPAKKVLTANSVAAANNKTAKKPLTKGKKQKQKQTVKKKPTPGKGKAKAVMNKTR